MAETVHAILSPEVRDRADMHARYYRTIPTDDAISGLCLRLASAEILDNRHSRMLAEATAERERLKAEVERLRNLLGQTTAALNVALHYAVNEPNWHDMPDAETSRTELDGCREALRQAVAELHPQAPTTPKPESAALIAAVDKLTEGSGR